MYRYCVLKIIVEGTNINLVNKAIRVEAVDTDVGVRRRRGQRRNGCCFRVTFQLIFSYIIVNIFVFINYLLLVYYPLVAAHSYTFAWTLWSLSSFLNPCCLIGTLDVLDYCCHHPIINVNRKRISL